MKSNFKLVAISILSGLALLFSVSSCNILSDGENFTEVESAEKINNLINKNITPDMLVYEIDFSFTRSSSSFSFMKDGITIVYVNPENEGKLSGIDIDIKTGEAKPSSFYERTSLSPTKSFKGYTPVEVDVTTMIQSIIDAINFLYEEEGIETSGLGHCEIKFGNTPSDIVYKFKTQTRTGSTSTGRRTQVHYDEYPFVADAEGNIEFD